MSKHPTKPCADCPYRKDAPVGHWDPSEFQNVLSAERSTLGAVFACHNHVTRPPAERGFCAGWALDQKARNVPSIALRLVLMRDSAVRAAFAQLDAGGLELYESVEGMCRANGVRPDGTIVRLRRKKERA